MTTVVNNDIDIIKMEYEETKADHANHPKNVEEELDQMAFGWFHVKIIIISGAGFFTDAYDLFCVGIVTS